MMLNTITRTPTATSRKMPTITTMRMAPTTQEIEHGDLEVQRGRGVRANERAPVLQHQVADEGGNHGDAHEPEQPPRWTSIDHIFSSDGLSCGVAW